MWPSYGVSTFCLCYSHHTLCSGNSLHPDSLYPHSFPQLVSIFSYILYRDLTLDPSFPFFLTLICYVSISVANSIFPRGSHFNPKPHRNWFVVNFSGTDLWMNNWAFGARVEPSTMTAVCLVARERLMEAGRWRGKARRMAFVCTRVL